MATNPRFEELTATEQQWVKDQLQGARTFVTAFSPRDEGKPVSLSALDRAFAAWLETSPESQDEVNSAINCVGMALGQALVKAAGFRWVIASDEQGTDLAVRALPGKGDVVVYPANFVAKRWQRRETHFLAAAITSIQQQVRQFTAHNADQS